MKAHVALDRCEGYANCVLNADRIFDIEDGSGQAVVLMAEIPAGLADELRRAAVSCPAQAITVED